MEGAIYNFSCYGAQRKYWACVRLPRPMLACRCMRVYSSTRASVIVMLGGVDPAHFWLILVKLSIFCREASVSPEYSGIGSFAPLTYAGGAFVSAG